VKKKTLVLTLGRSGAYTANPPKKGGKKNPSIYPRQPAGKGRKKIKIKIKTLVLTLGSPPKKGGEKKTLVLTLDRLLDLDFRTWMDRQRN
jgi:hypothetical protein